MGTFNQTTPKRLVLTDVEQTSRAAAIAATGSPSPVPYVPIFPVPSVYTHVGHDAQYGKGRRDGRFVRLLILHTTEAESFVGSMSYGARRPEQVSATCYAGGSGELGYGVPEENRPYTTQRWNDESLSVEICGKAAWTAEQWRARPLQMGAIVLLLIDWCKRYSIPPRWLTPSEVALGASRYGSPPVQGTNFGITDHWNANLAARLLGASDASTTHTDIGPGLREVFLDDLLPDVIRHLSTQPTPIPTPEPEPTPPSDDTEESMPFLIKKANGETAVVYGSGKMVGLQGSEIPRFQDKFGLAILVTDSTYLDFASKGKV